MISKKSILLFVFSLIFGFNLQGKNLEEKDSIPPKLKIGIKAAPPFVNIEKGDYTGLSVDLWRNIAEKNGFVYEFKTYDLVGLLNALEQKEIDICISPLSVTSQRMEQIDFTQPYFISNLAIAYSPNQNNKILSFIRNFFSINFLKAILILFLIIFVFGFLFWLLEKNKNDQLESNWKGIGEGIWWSAVTMTTVGYGDRYPVTKWGKLISIIWMFTAIIIISGLTAGITSALTINQLENEELSFKKLKQKKIATIDGSISANFLSEQNIDFQKVKDVETGLKQLLSCKVDAFLYDKAIVQYYIHAMDLDDEILVAHQGLNSNYYAFALPQNHVLFKKINLSLIKSIENPNWKTILDRYDLKN